MQLHHQKAGFRTHSKQSDEIQAKLDEAGLDLMEYGDNGRYRIRLGKGDVQSHDALLKELLQKAYAESEG